MKTKKRSLIALSLLLASLLSCGNNTTDPSDTTDSVTTGTETVTREPEIKPDTPDTLTFPGRTFAILTGEYNDYCMIGAEQSDGEVVNDARRTMMNNTADRFDIEVTEESKYVFDLNMAINTLVSSGDETYSIINHLDRFATSAMTSGLLRPMDDLTDVDFTMPWWNPAITDQLIVGDIRYLASSASSILMYADTMALWINTTLAASYDIDVTSIYEDVRNGTWTMDKMMEYAALVTGEVNGDNTMDGMDRYGLFPLDMNLAGTTLVTAGGMQSVSRDSAGFSVNWESERYIELAEKAYNIMHGDDTFLNNARNKAEMFTEGRALFMPAIFHSATNKITDMTDDYTCVPIPKYSEDQETYVCANYDVMFFCLPKSVNDTEFSGTVVDWLSYEGLKHVKDAYVLDTMKGKKSINPDMQEMVQLCLDCSMIDLGAIFAPGVLSYDSLWGSVFSKKTFELSSYIAKRQTILENQLTKIIEAVEENKD